MIIPTQAGIAKDCVAHIVKRVLGLLRPQIPKRHRILLAKYIAESCNADLEIRDETGVKLHEPDELSHVSNDNRRGPVLQQLVL